MCWVIRRDAFMAAARQGIRTASQLRTAAANEQALGKRPDWGFDFSEGVRRIVEPEHSAARQQIADELARRRGLERDFSDCKRRCSDLRRQMSRSRQRRADVRIELHRVEEHIETAIKPGLAAVDDALRALYSRKQEAEVVVDCPLWDDVRYVLEADNGLVVDDPDDIEALRSRRLGKKQREKLGGRSVIVATRGTDALLPESRAFALSGEVDLRSLRELDPETVIVWHRVPSDDDKHNMHVPPRFQAVRQLMMYLQRWRPEAERIKYAQILCAANDTNTGCAERVFRVEFHPSREWCRKRYMGFIDASCNECQWGAEYVRPPPRHYVCPRCFGYYADPPHLAEQCPTIDRADWVPMHERLRPSSIPLSRLREVQWDAPEAEVAAARYIKPESDGSIRLFNPR